MAVQQFSLHIRPGKLCDGVVRYYTLRDSGLVNHPYALQTALMRALFSLVVVAALAVAAYYFFLKKMPLSDDGTASTQAITLTGVRADLLQLAQAERGFIASNGHCASLDELVSSNSLTMSRFERDGYSYSIDCSSEFSVVARHAPVPQGTSIRYPVLAIDQTMQVHEVN
ncbi:MAG: hypothetical protein NVS9B4_23430 [Candidatus Acidiferrum sp.]